MIAFLAVCIAPFMTTKETYPRAIWARFRQLMRQPKAMRCRRDMSVCAMLLSVRSCRLPYHVPGSHLFVDASQRSRLGEVYLVGLHTMFERRARDGSGDTDD